MTDKEQSQKAKKFVGFWNNKGYEKGNYSLNQTAQICALERNGSKNE